MLFNLILEYVIIQLEVDVNGMLEHKAVQIVSYADDMNIMDRTQASVKEKIDKGSNTYVNIDKTKCHDCNEEKQEEA